MPVDGHTVQEKNVPTSWSSCHTLTSMIRVHKNSHYKWESKWLWHVGRDLLLQLYSWSRLDKVCPIIFLEIFHINILNCWFEYKSEFIRFLNKQTHGRPPSYVLRVSAPDVRTSSIPNRWYQCGQAIQYIGGCRSENGSRMHLLDPNPQ